MKRILYLLPILLITACELYEQDGYTELYVIESFLVADEPFPQILISTTARIDDRYSFGERAVNNASVHIHELNEDGVKVRHIPYRQSDQPGRYIPVSSEEIVQPGTRYLLEIFDLPDDDAFITSNTYVPGSFEIIDINADTLAYQRVQQFEITMTRGFYRGRQNIFIFTTEALDTVNYSLTPLYQNEFAEQFGGDSFKRVSSPIINEGNYDINNDNSITVRLPWLMIAYLGPNRISTYAIDDNVYDFYRSAEVQLGGPNQSPGEIENVIYNVEGGIGIFGSMAGVSTEIYVRPLH